MQRLFRSFEKNRCPTLRKSNMFTKAGHMHSSDSIFMRTFRLFMGQCGQNPPYIGSSFQLTTSFGTLEPQMLCVCLVKTIFHM